MLAFVSLFLPPTLSLLPSLCLCPSVSVALQFNCTYRQRRQQQEEESSETLPKIVPAPGIPPVQNTSFNIQLFNTQSSPSPSRQAFYTVSQNQQVFVEVNLKIWFSTKKPSHNPNLFLTKQRLTSFLHLGSTRVHISSSLKAPTHRGGRDTDGEDLFHKRLWGADVPQYQRVMMAWMQSPMLTVSFNNMRFCNGPFTPSH